MATKLTKKQQGELTEKLMGVIQKNNALQLRLSADNSVNEMGVNQISGELNRIHGQAIGKELPTVITFAPKQAGTGDPSPTNIRPISGYEITGIGTVYGGELNIETSTLTVNTVYIPLPAIAGTAVASDVRRWYTGTVGDDFGYIAAVACDSLKASPQYVFAQPDYVSFTTNGRIAVTPSWANALTSVSDFNAALIEHPINLVVTKSTPETYTLTPQQMLQLLDQL